MIYTPLTIKAINCAYQAHLGQYDKSGIPYIFHPYHVAEQMTDEISVCAALLHDVVEDTDITIQMLEKDFPKEVIDAVRLLTHDPSVPYMEYIEGLKSNDVARRVKLADLDHNSDNTRIPSDSKESDEKILNRLKKYAKAKELLLNK